jgi:hypothetical protein
LVEWPLCAKRSILAVQRSLGVGIFCEGQFGDGLGESGRVFDDAIERGAK